MWEDHRSREGYCDVCGDPLDPYNYSLYPNRPMSTRGDFVRDNLKFGKCYNCRKFVPDVHRSLARFWKEFYS